MVRDRRGWAGLLVGVANYPDDPAIPDLPAVENNILDLRATLADPDIAGFEAEKLELVVNPQSQADVMRPLNRLRDSAADLLLVYYSGHGLIGDDGQLYLALATSCRNEVDYTSLPADRVRRAMTRSGAATRVLIVDCCFSGRVLGVLAEPGTLVAASLDVHGAVTIASAPENFSALSPPGEKHTAFTGELLEVMREGISTISSTYLDIEAIFGRVQRLLAQKARPLPQMLNENQAHHIPFVRNRAIAPRKPAAYPRYEKFPALIHTIRTGMFTPILGWSLTDQLLGSRQKIGLRWAQDFDFPNAVRSRDGLAHVAQYLAVGMGHDFPSDQLGMYVRTALAGWYANELPESYRGRPPQDLPLGKLLSDAWRLRYRDPASDPFAILAKLPVPLYVTTQPWNLLAEALRDAGKDPRVELLRWKLLNEDSADKAEVDVPDWAFQFPEDPVRQDTSAAAGWPTSVFERDPFYRPDVDRPLVYHLFGHWARPRTVALTEKDYYDFLLTVSRDISSLPHAIRKAFADRSVLFLGFQHDEQDFTALYRFLLNVERRRYRHVIQIDPEEEGGATIDPDRARQYLEKSFQTSEVEVYWGSAESFLKELLDHWVAGA